MKGPRSWKGLIVCLLISVTVIQNVQCEEKKPATTPEKKETKSAKKDKDKPIIVVAEKVESPQNWNSWTPVSQNSTSWLPTPMTTPLTVIEQEKRIVAQLKSPATAPVYPGTHYSKPTKKQKKRGSEKYSPMEDLRSRAMSYGKRLVELMSGGTMADLLPSSGSEGWWAPEGRSPGHGESEPGEMRGSVLSWLSRLIGVEGKSLGEFLREYQVHVLYDLAFTFFKWIFFLYAGLLIP